MAINRQNELAIGQTEIRDDPILHDAILKLGKGLLLRQQKAKAQNQNEF